MMASDELQPTSRQNVDAAVAHLRATALVWSRRRMYGECCVRLRFVDGCALQWEAIQSELHKTGQDRSVPAD